MKVIIFAGGSGRRLWPISLERSPKQFEPIIGDKSTLQLAVERVLDVVGADNIYVSTNEQYIPLVTAQLPMLSPRQFIGEPVRRDLAAAVGLALCHVAHSAESDEPIAILWGDNYMVNPPVFQRLLQAGADLIRQGRAEIVYMGETPRFANENLGWIGLRAPLGECGGAPYFAFGSLTYRPSWEQCQAIFAAGTHVWNTGYFITTAPFMQAQYARFQPELWAGLTRIAASIGTAAYSPTLQATYPQLAEMSFDDAVLVHIDPAAAVVLHGEMGWSDPGTLYALKEAINPDTSANVARGLVELEGSQDCLVYNYQAGKLVVAIGLDGMIVVNTDRAVLVVHKDQIPLVKKVVNRLADSDLSSYT